MNDLDLQFRLIDGTARLAQFGGTWLVQSTLLLSMGLVAGWLVRRRGAAAQSAVYRMTLVAALASPLASGVLDRTGVIGWSVDLPAAVPIAARGPVARGGNEPHSCGSGAARGGAGEVQCGT